MVCRMIVWCISCMLGDFILVESVKSAMTGYCPERI